MVAKALARNPLAQSLGSWARHLIELGTSGYPPKIRRRMRNINVGCYTIAVSCALRMPTRPSGGPGSGEALTVA
jgi:hypothetical protein